jgi:NAD(P)-dependent dehydrogenase (short-subunit alcohol dehydrogenase family)
MLKDQVVLITGCSTGIGRALAAELAGRGQRVFATARRLEALEPLRHPAVDRLALDVLDAASIEAAVAEVVRRAGRIDILINNAGVNLVGPLVEVPLESVGKIFDTNVTGLLALTQAVFPHMARQRSGRVVNVGSVVGLLPTPFAGPYCASKAAVHMLSEVLRMELAPFGIDVIVVQPGGVRSQISETASQDLARYAAPESHYRAAHEGIVRRAQASQDRPMESDAFARRVVDAILSDVAPRTVRAGRGARLYPALTRLPVGARDRLLARRFGLTGLARRP